MDERSIMRRLHRAGFPRIPLRKSNHVKRGTRIMLAQILEAAMLVCFGLSWPLNAYKSYKAATAVGTSWQFILLITLGYVAGIAAKFAGGMLNWVLVVYFINVVCIGANWVVYFRNVKLDQARGTQAR